jgi:hypothetical protein
LRLRRLSGRADGLLAASRALADALLLLSVLASALGAAALSPSLPRVTRHQRVSRCVVWRPHQRQYLRSSTRSGVFRFDFELW